MKYNIFVLVISAIAASIIIGYVFESKRLGYVVLAVELILIFLLRKEQKREI
ncbi:MAG: hypothetical protein K2Q21_00050 [Chitinophagaceae bacterium]|nr:hypothetical protein [Chitinophagaceae bacterium]